MPSTPSTHPASFADVLGFWFGEPESPGLGRPRPQWFRKDPGFDETIRSRFGATLEAAAAGRLDDWEATPYATLALTVVLDQFPRNLFRDDARAFATDARALAVARRAIGRGFDQLLRPLERTFLYLPFEHCEELAAQRRALALFSRLRDFPDCASSIDYARRHYEIVLRFGRFPHRNSALGRASTGEEQRFLTQPGSRF